jgi:hypothetical protein
MASKRGSEINPDPVELVLARLRELGRNPRQSYSKPGQWSARCPAHDDRRPSLSVGTGDDGRALMNCKKGCGIGAVTTALGLRLSDLHPHDYQGRPVSSLHYGTLKVAIDAQAERIGGEHVATYPYDYADGRKAFVVVRYQTAKGKQIFPFRQNRTGRWTIGAPNGKGYRPLYRVRDVVQAPRVVVVEGEKCADLMASELGLVATTSAFGARGPNRTDWSPLAGKQVLLVPDCGAPGCKYAREIFPLLFNLNPAPSVKVVNLPGLDEGEDIEQWLDRQPADGTPDQAIKAFEALVAASAGPPRYDACPTELQRAIDWLREALAKGPIPSTELWQRAKAEGISRRTLDRAKPLAGVRGVRIGNMWYSALDVEVEPPAPKNAKKTAKKNGPKAAKSEGTKNAKNAIKDAKPSYYVDLGKDLLSSDPDSGSLSPDPDPDALTVEVSEPEKRADDPHQVTAPAPEPTTEPTPALASEPAAYLYQLVRDHYDPADRPVMTPQGSGQLWQVFAERAGVILETAPERVTFFDPNLITSARPPGEASSPATTGDQGPEAHGCRAGSHPTSGPSGNAPPGPEGERAREGG